MKCNGECELCDICGLQHQEDELGCVLFQEMTVNAGLTSVNGNVVSAIDQAYSKGYWEGYRKATPPSKDLDFIFNGLDLTSPKPE